MLTVYTVLFAFLTMVSNKRLFCYKCFYGVSVHLYMSVTCFCIWIVFFFISWKQQLCGSWIERYSKPPVVEMSFFCHIHIVLSLSLSLFLSVHFCIGINFSFLPMGDVNGMQMRIESLIVFIAPKRSLLLLNPIPFCMHLLSASQLFGGY